MTAPATITIADVRNAYRRVFVGQDGELTGSAKIIIARMRQIGGLDAFALPRPPIAVTSDNEPVLGAVDPLMLASNEGARSAIARLIAEIDYCLNHQEQLDDDDRRNPADPIA